MLWRGGIAPLIRNLGISWKRVVSFTSPPYPLNRWLVGPQSRSGRFWGENNFLPVPGIETQFFDHPAHRVVTMRTTVSQLPLISFFLFPFLFSVFPPISAVGLKKTFSCFFHFEVKLQPNIDGGTGEMVLLVQREFQNMR